jgi:hypothetical protein
MLEPGDFPPLSIMPSGLFGVSAIVHLPDLFEQETLRTRCSSGDGRRDIGRSMSSREPDVSSRTPE